MKKEQGTLPRCWGRTQRRSREDQLEVWRDLDGTKGTSLTRVVHQRPGSGVRAEPQHGALDPLVRLSQLGERPDPHRFPVCIGITSGGSAGLTPPSVLYPRLRACILLANMHGDAETRLSLAEAGQAFGMSDATLRRLCERGVLRAERVGRAWRISRREMENYLLARRGVGSPGGNLRLAGPPTQERGATPNPSLRDAFAWRFEGLVNGELRHFDIWLSSELVALLRRDGYDVRELVVSGAGPIIEDAMLCAEGELPSGEIWVRTQQELLRAAGRAPNQYWFGEAPLEEGVAVLYDFTMRDFARDGVWAGDTLPVTDIFVDAIVDHSVWDQNRRILTVRLLREGISSSRREILGAAIDHYRARCKRVGVDPAGWVDALESRLGRPLLIG